MKNPDAGGPYKLASTRLELVGEKKLVFLDIGTLDGHSFSFAMTGEMLLRFASDIDQARATYLDMTDW
jgi:hypothetical protein